MIDLKNGKKKFLFFIDARSLQPDDFLESFLGAHHQVRHNLVRHVFPLLFQPRFQLNNSLWGGSEKCTYFHQKLFLGDMFGDPSSMAGRGDTTKRNNVEGSCGKRTTHIY